MADHALSHLRPEDAQRRASLVELREKAAAEKQRASQVTQTSYLLGKLPVETLVQIFTVLIDEDHTWAVKLSHVCGHWRLILINTPSAWQTLVLSKRHPFRKAKLWKQRAKNRIARISVSMPSLDRASVFAQLQDLDFSSLRISGEAFVELHRILSDVSLLHKFSMLDELILFDYACRDHLSGPNWNLKTLHLIGSISMVDEWWKRIQQLKELCLDGAVAGFSDVVFTANPSLEKLVLNGRGTWQVDELNIVTPISMDNLKHIECRGLAEHSYILCAISAPSITHFIIDGLVMPDDALRIAGRPSLVELRITHCITSPFALSTLLSSTPNLETLQVNSVLSHVNEMFQFLTPKTVDSLHPLPCRALKHVDVSRCPDLTTSSAYAFVKTRVQYASEFVESAERCAVVVSLKMDGCPHIEPDMLPWFRSKVAQFSCIYATKKDFKKNWGRVL